MKEEITYLNGCGHEVYPFQSDAHHAVISTVVKGKLITKHFLFCRDCKEEIPERLNAMMLELSRREYGL